MILKDVLFFWVLLAAHLLGDFYLPQKKPRKIFDLVPRCAAYGACVMAAALGAFGCGGLRGGAAAALGHALLEAGKLCLPKCSQRLRGWMERRKGWALAAEQALHLAVLTAAAVLLPAQILPWVSGLREALGCVYSLSGLLRLCCLLLLLGKPANIALKLCNSKPDTGERPAADGQGVAPADRRAGAVIGTLERMLTAVLFLLGQYGAISVVFAGKTLTRYQKIAESPEFGEYYLTGTLGSLLLAVVSTMLLFPPAR